MSAISASERQELCAGATIFMGTIVTAAHRWSQGRGRREVEHDIIGPKSSALQQRAMKVMPLGVNSNFRFWGEGKTPYVSHGKGACLWDVDGNRFIDYRLAYGPVILGHADSDVDDFVMDALRRGQLFAMTDELEVGIAEMMTEMVPGLDMIRLACSGTEATMHAIRLARAYSGGDIILKFEGNYHGMQDNVMWSTIGPTQAYGSKRSPIPVPTFLGFRKICCRTSSRCRLLILMVLLE